MMRRLLILEVDPQGGLPIERFRSLRAFLMGSVRFE